MALENSTSPVLTLRYMVQTIQAACVLGLGVLAGCASILPPSPLTPLLVADSADVKLIEALAREQDTRVESCEENKSCPQDQYTRGLIALFQSRERAVAAFQQVKSVVPNSRLATLSTSWMDLLQASGGVLSFLNVQSAGVPKVTEDFVWAALERDLDEANQSVRRLFSDRAKRVGGLTDRRAAIQALHRQLHERDRTLGEREQQIDVMASQLDALKRIDQDTRYRARPLRPSAIVAP
jgi:hypothetical protein